MTAVRPSGHVAVEASAEAFLAIAAERSLRGHRPLVVRDEASAAEAVRAALRGDDLVVHARADRAILDRMYDDLRRLGSVTVRTAQRPPSGEDLLTADEVALLRLLAAGRTLREAARELYIAPRTADRRLAGARAALGVATTMEAVAAIAR